MLITELKDYPIFTAFLYVLVVVGVLFAVATESMLYEFVTADENIGLGILGIVAVLVMVFSLGFIFVAPLITKMRFFIKTHKGQRLIYLSPLLLCGILYVGMWISAHWNAPNVASATMIVSLLILIDILSDYYFLYLQAPAYMGKAILFTTVMFVLVGLRLNLFSFFSLGKGPDEMAIYVGMVYVILKFTWTIFAVWILKTNKALVTDQRGILSRILPS